MPWPISLYQRPFSSPTSMPAAFQRSSSAIWVPERSPREMKGALEIVVHHGVSFDAETVGDEFLLLRLGVHEQHIGVAASAGVERLAGALRHHLHVDAGLGLEQRQDVAEQSGVLRRRGGGDHNGFVLRAGG